MTLATSQELRRSLAPYESYPLDGLLTRASQRFGNKTAVIDGDRRFTYRQVGAHSDRLAAALAGMGVVKGDRVAILAPNCVEFVISFFGILKAGAVVSTVNSGYREREIAHQLNDSGAETLIVHEALKPVADLARDDVRGLKREIVISSDSSDSSSFWGLLESAPDAPPNVTIDPMNDLAALPYSSGTTGLSKGVMLTHYNLASNVRQFVSRKGEEASLTENDVILTHLPLFHIYGMNVLMNGAIGTGATQVMMGRFDMDEFLGLMSGHGVTVLFTVPPVGLGLTQYPAVRDTDLSALRVGFFGAAPLSEDMQLRIQDALATPIIQGYGMTEASPVTHADFMEPHLIKPGSIGPAMPDTDAKVVDVETGENELTSNEIGELVVRGPQVMKGYYNNEAATAETLTEDGWLHTGDIVRMDEDGYVWVLDRKKELIKYKGFQVPPAELEGVLLEHPGISDAAVIGKEDLESGEIPKAFVVANPDVNLSADDVMSFVAGKVATFKHVREVEFMDAIPKNPSGKILRRTLIEREREQGR
ncbi:MAG: 4-coumarate--CoA ligase family protein [Dehalococcoidia bacterium]|nr:4-coumarate--CoA ligase family protein [Dehalococcoidia bacterium]